MTTTDLKPGDAVQHPEKGYGIVAKDGTACYLKGNKVWWALDLTGWERVETCTEDAVRILEDYQKIESRSVGTVARDNVVMMTPAVYEAHHGRETVRPGHVQVRVDDLDPEALSEWSQWAACNSDEDALVRIGRAFVARQVEQGDPHTERAESAPPAESHTEPAATETVTDSGAPKLTSATVTLPCPDCGETITRTAGIERYTDGDLAITWTDIIEQSFHTCPPAQPDEPTGFGARVTVTDHHAESTNLWCRQRDGYWANEDGDLAKWADLCQHGIVTIGWDD